MLPHSSHFVLAGCIAFLVAVSIACVYPLSVMAAVVVIVGGVVVLATHPREIAFLGCMVACAGFGFLRVAFVAPYDVVDGEVVDTVGVVDTEPEIFVNHQRVVLRFESGIRAQTDIPLEPRFAIDDHVRVHCTLEKPKASEDFSYDRYLARYRIAALCKHAVVEWQQSTTTLRSRVLTVKQFIVDRVRRTMPLPEHAIVLGMVFGVDHQLPQDSTNAFRVTGTTHLLVISGSQIVLIIGVCMKLLQHVPLRRRTAMLCIVGLLVCYAIMTGWQASVLRAGLCACCLFAAELLGRMGGGLRILLYAATAMVVVTPYLLLYDAGFQLSFLATFGIIAFANAIEKRLVWLPRAIGVRTATATSMAAMIPTTPLIAYSFHTFSPVSLFTNSVAVPLAGVLTITGFLFSFVAAVSPMMGHLLAPVVFTLARLFIAVVVWFSHVPYASMNVAL